EKKCDMTRSCGTFKSSQSAQVVRESGVAIPRNAPKAGYGKVSGLAA
ncbi:MAG: hypothetical protein ACI8W8_003892, partial [Rhodothermales bacterium]